MSDDESLQACAERIETLLREVESVAGPLAWPRVQSLVTSLVELYGAALGRVLDHGAAAARDRAEFEANLTGDELVASLLALHDIHPVPVERRVDRALDRVRSQLDGGTRLELDGIQDGVASVRASGAGTGSGAILSQLVTRAIEHDVPELAGVRVEGLAPPAAPPEAFVSVDRLLHKARP